MLPIICIALVMRLRHATGGAYVLIRTCWGLWQRLLRRGLNFSTAWRTVRQFSAEKDWKHALKIFISPEWIYPVAKQTENNKLLMQKVVTLNTCCDIACLTFQLPHITTDSFQSHRRQPTTGSFRSFQRLKERNKPSVGWKSFAFHKLVCMNNTVENDFLGFPRVK